jgi:hypothetical protein
MWRDHLSKQSPDFLQKRSKNKTKRKNGLLTQAGVPKREGQELRQRFSVQTVEVVESGRLQSDPIERHKRETRRRTSSCLPHGGGRTCRIGVSWWTKERGRDGVFGEEKGYIYNEGWQES